MNRPHVTDPDMIRINRIIDFLTAEHTQCQSRIEDLKRILDTEITRKNNLNLELKYWHGEYLKTAKTKE